MPSPSLARTLLPLALLCATCTPLRDGDERRVVVRAAFDSGTVTASKDGITLRGQLTWHSQVAGSQGPVTLRATLVPPPPR